MSKNPDKTHVLDVFSCTDIRRWGQHYKTIANYYWDHYCYFAQQRSLIFDELKAALLNHCCSFEFAGWQRLVTYKFSLNPLSAKGSIINDPGGRFNIGNIDQIKFSPFAALYLAEDRDTAFKEKFGLYKDEKVSGLTAEDLALHKDESITMVAVKGKIEQTIDINNANLIKDFYSLIKTITLPDKFIRRARKLNISSLPQLKSPKQLLTSLLNPNWRQMPALVDVPANSQIFGQVAFLAGFVGNY